MRIIELVGVNAGDSVVCILYHDSGAVVSSIKCHMRTSQLHTEDDHWHQFSSTDQFTSDTGEKVGGYNDANHNPQFLWEKIH